MPFIAKTTDIPNRSSIEFEYNGHPAILVNWDGEFHAFINECTHEGGPNFIAGEVLLCAWHSSTFDPKSGEALSRPAPPGSRLPEIKLKIEGESIYAL